MPEDYRKVTKMSTSSKQIKETKVTNLYNYCSIICKDISWESPWSSYRVCPAIASVIGICHGEVSEPPEGEGRNFDLSSLRLLLKLYIIMFYNNENLIGRGGGCRVIMILNTTKTWSLFSIWILSVITKKCHSLNLELCPGLVLLHYFKSNWPIILILGAI